MPTRDASLILVNANVLTMDRAHPRSEAVAISGEHILGVGTNAAIRLLSSRKTRIIDCKGLTLLPGFNDAHCHLPGLARRLQDLDCSPQQAPSIIRLQALVLARTANQPTAAWIRGFGYDDLRLAEQRHPNRHDLDSAAPDCPVWLEHRSGHAAALNSLALELGGIHRETPDPPGGLIERDPNTGEPTGILYEMRTFLRNRLGSTRSSREFDVGMRAVDELLRGYGITSVQDAGHDNGINRWRTFERLQADGILSSRITMFAGIGRMDELTAMGLSYGSAADQLILGHAKIVLTLTSGALHPSLAELEAMVAEAHDKGFPVAVHCIEEEAIAVAAATLEVGKLPGLMDRIEHCAEGTPHLIGGVKRSKAAVVTQPGFLYHNGESYRHNVDERLLPHLYPAGALVRSGAATAFGSDAPVIDPNPWPAIYSSVTRCASDGKPLAIEGAALQALTVEEALRTYTLGSAQAEGKSKIKGSLAPGKLADMVLVNSDPLSIDSDLLPEVRTVMTIAGGSVVWENQ